MTVDVLDQPAAESSLRLSFRTRLPGPEEDLVDWFLQSHRFRTPRTARVTVFREPRLESGFPDLVYVVWNPAIAREWPEYRARLVVDDLRVMQHFLDAGPMTPSTLTDHLGTKALASLDPLLQAGMIRRQGSDYAARSLSKIFAVKHILAFEAKMGEWSSALGQARLNLWFASESFVLVPSVPKGRRLLEEAAQHGVGVCARASKPTVVQAGDVHGLPRSYASWLFNEWVWRANGIEA